MAKANAISGDNGANDFVIPHTRKGNDMVKNSQPLRRSRLGPGLGSGPGSGCGPGPSSRPLCEGLSTFGGAEVEHKAVVELVFLAYNHVSTETRHTLIQVATTVAQSVGDDMAVDAVQLMRMGWWIYLRTYTDCTHLVVQGITLAGKHIPLRSEFHLMQQKTVKITIRDLPLHEVDNDQVLEAMHILCTVHSEVLYGTVWHEGQPTSIWNGDQFIYVSEDAVPSLPDSVEIAGLRRRVIKPAAMRWCHCCGEIGHKALDPSCPARAPEGLQGNLEIVHGGKNPLSNLHNCEENCVIKDGQYDFTSSEQHYQFNRLHFHGKIDASYRVLEVDLGFQAMKIAKSALPKDEEKPEWKDVALREMETSNVLKFESCAHARAVLASANSHIVEATSNAFWGSGLLPDLTRMTLVDYWPGENQFGKVLMKIKTQMALDEMETSGDKWKASSPLVSHPKLPHQ